MHSSAALLAAACLAIGAGCGKDEGKTGEEKGKTGETAGAPAGEAAKGAPEAGKPAAAADPASLAEKIGVEPGPVEYDADEGAAAVVAAAQGKVEVRPVGTETWAETKVEAQLHEGDQVRAPDGGQVTLTLVDETSVEVAEESAVAIGSRKATEDPASSVAVLYGVARFTVAERAPGEGPFMVFTPGGVVATKGTVYTVGVAASGQSRVGVEEGEVEVAGAAKLDAPVPVAAGKAVLLAPAGELGEVEAIGEADWGAWRDGAEADVDVKAAAEFHAHRAEALEAELEAAYAELEAQTAAAAEAEVKVEAAAEAEDPAAYQEAAPELGGAVDASFAMSLRLQYLTSAMLADAYVADALYVRHPEVVAVIEPARPRLAGAILWHKKYHAVADLHVEPLRAAYYVHSPVGRAHASLVAYPIPPFYARVKLSYPAPVVRSRLKVAIYQPPIVRPSVRVKRKVYVRAPRVGWYAGARVHVRPAPARVRWYVRPARPRARVVFGAPPSAKVKVKTVFVAAPPRPRAKAVVRFGAGVRGDVRRPEPRDHRVEVRRAPEPRDHRDGVRGSAGVTIRAGVGASAPPPPPPRDHRAEVRAGVRVGGGSDAHAGGKARVKVSAPKVKVKAPKVKGKLKVKGGLKIGN